MTYYQKKSKETTEKDQKEIVFVVFVKRLIWINCKNKKWQRRFVNNPYIKAPNEKGVTVHLFQKDTF